MVCSSAEEATADMAKKELQVTVQKKCIPLLDGIDQLTWQRSEKSRKKFSAIYY